MLYSEMVKLAWATDIHLNFISEAERSEFCAAIRRTDADAVLIGGDIGEAPDVTGYLALMEAELQRPIYFVLGNHDFYRGSLSAVRARVKELASASRWLRWLPAAGVVKLTDKTALVGHDGWGDARIGNFESSNVQLSDFIAIEDLKGLGLRARLPVLRRLGDEAAEHFRRVLPEALDRFEHVLVLTHVPPFKESCWYEGRISSDEWLPYFTCKGAGDALQEAMMSRPDRSMQVLCGHTHGGGEAHIFSNLLVRTGAAQYGRPELQKPLIELE